MDIGLHNPALTRTPIANSLGTLCKMGTLIEAAAFFLTLGFPSFQTLLSLLPSQTPPLPTLHLFWILNPYSWFPLAQPACK